MKERRATDLSEGENPHPPPSPVPGDANQVHGGKSLFNGSYFCCELIKKKGFCRLRTPVVFQLLRHLKPISSHAKLVQRVPQYYLLFPSPVLMPTLITLKHFPVIEKKKGSLLLPSFEHQFDF